MFIPTFKNSPRRICITTPRVRVWTLYVFILSLLPLLQMPLHANGESATLVLNGEAKAVIVLREGAVPPEQYAAEELSSYLAKITGANIGVTSSFVDKGGQTPIYIGIAADRFLPELKADVEKLGKEGFIYRAGKEGVVITAKNPMGVLYGTYAFLEEVLGVRWLMPGPEGEFWPVLKTVEVSKVQSSQQPFFKDRRLGLSCTNINTVLKDTWVWMVRNRMQVESHYDPFWRDPEVASLFGRLGVKLSGGGHVLASFVPVETYYDAHPEYFSLVGGTRRKGDHGVDEHGQVYQRCTSNPEVIRLGADYIKDFFGEPRNGESFLIGNNDGAGWCECIACKALDDPQEAKEDRVTTRFFKYINAVTDEVLKEYPDKDLRAWAYQMFRSPPLGVAPHPKVSLYVALHGRCYRHPLDHPTCPFSAEMRKVLAGWSSFGNPFGAREYYACILGDQLGAYMIDSYYPMEDVVGRDIKYLASIGGTIWEDETPPPDGVFGPAWDRREVRESWLARFPMYYVAAKLLWNPNLDLEQIKDDAYKGWYGPAHEEMSAYRRLLSKSWIDTAAHFPFAANPIFIGQALEKAGVKTELLRLLHEAERKTAGSKIHYDRIIKEKSFFVDTWVKMADQLGTISAWYDVHTQEAREPVTIDANFSEPEWNEAPIITGFHTGLSKIAEHQTFVRVLHTQDSVIFGMEMMEPTPGQMNLRATERDGRVWADNGIELFIKPKPDDLSYYHIAINAKGAIYDARCTEGGATDQAFNGDYEVKTSVLDDRWVVEIRIPYSSLGVKPSNGDQWKVGIARSRSIGNASENSSWTDGTYHQVSSFRTLVFGGEPPLVSNGGFERTVEIAKESERTFYGISPEWELGNSPNLFPLEWSLHEAHPGRLTLFNEGAFSGQWSAELERGWIYTGLEVQEGQELATRFWAKGGGTVKVMFFQYAYEGATPKEFLETVVLGDIPLTDEWKEYTLNYKLTAKGVNRVGLAFAASDVLMIDDISVKEVKE